MPWQYTDLISMREKFIQEAEQNKDSFSALCRKFNITRKTGYKWMQRYQKEGVFGLIDRSRRPCQIPIKTDKEVVDLVLEKRRKRHWGAKKLRQDLINEGHINIPSVATINRILSCSGEVSQEESGKRTHYIRFEKELPNELWQMDFKGYFLTVDGKCHPLTILDDCSRFSICLQACSSENEIIVRNALEKAFREYGLPIAMTMDNGSPWKGYPSQRLSSLTVWLMRQGIKVSHSRPGHPQTQGKDERFHRTLKEELLKYHNFQDLKDAQRHFNEWREVYNHIRPHEALDMKSPGQKYSPSPKLYQENLPPIEYPSTDKVKKVGTNGEIWFQNKRCYVGGHLRGEYVGLRQTGEDRWDIYYCNTRICGFDLKVYTMS